MHVCTCTLTCGFHFIFTEYLEKLELQYAASGRNITLSEFQLAELEKNFRYTHVLLQSDKYAIASFLLLPETAVEDWFKVRLERFNQQYTRSNEKCRKRGEKRKGQGMLMDTICFQ